MLLQVFDESLRFKTKVRTCMNTIPGFVQLAVASVWCVQYGRLTY